MGYIVRQTVSSDSAAATENVTSMINLKKTTSADAKGVSVTSEALSSDPSYNRERRVHPAAKVRIPRSRMGLGLVAKTIIQHLAG